MCSDLLLHAGVGSVEARTAGGPHTLREAVQVWGGGGRVGGGGGLGGCSEQGEGRLGGRGGREGGREGGC
jgi:hypothetical protein